MEIRTVLDEIASLAAKAALGTDDTQTMREGGVAGDNAK